MTDIDDLRSAKSKAWNNAIAAQHNVDMVRSGPVIDDAAVDTAINNFNDAYRAYVDASVRLHRREVDIVENNKRMLLAS